MATRPRAIKDDRAIFLEGVHLKAWSPKNLQWQDWDFAKLKDFPSEHLRLAWLYEVDRELGSGNPSFWAAWENYEKKKRKEKLLADINGTRRLPLDELLKLVPMPPDKNEIEAETEIKKMLENPNMSMEEIKLYDEKERSLNHAKSNRLNKLLLFEATAVETNWMPPIPKEPEPMLKSYDHREFCEMKIINIDDYWISGSTIHSTIHPLEIDWTLTETELVRAFRNWLRKGDHVPFRSNYKRVVRESKVGKRKKSGWLAWLRELAIYRISEAGFSRSEGLHKLNLKPVGKEKKPAISAANWEHAQARTRKRIEEEKGRCEFSAWDQGQGSPDNWRDYFVKPFGGLGL